MNGIGILALGEAVRSLRGFSKRIRKFHKFDEVLNASKDD